jgi:hypothetical protein
MKSPFPGMDPYIETAGLWQTFSHSLIHEIARHLAETLPSKYLVRTGKRNYHVPVYSEEELIYPVPLHVRAATDKGTKKLRARMEKYEPVMMRAFILEEHREAFLDIYEAVSQQRPVTTLEILSPSNKRPGTFGWELYNRKRQSLLLGGINLVEIDLLRGGQRMPMLDPWPDCPYTLLVARAYKEQSCKVWPGHWKRPLPTIPVPLAKPDADLPVAIQNLVDTVYQKFRFAQSIDYSKPLHPPLGDKDAAWLKKQLKARKAEG